MNGAPINGHRRLSSSPSHAGKAMTRAHRSLDDDVPRLLADLTMIVNGGSSLPIRLCAEHLALLGVDREPPRPGAVRSERDPSAVGTLGLRPRIGVDARLGIDDR